MVLIQDMLIIYPKICIREVLIMKYSLQVLVLWKLHQIISTWNCHCVLFLKPKYAKKQENEMLHMLSIWNPSYRPRPTVSEGSVGTTTAASNRPCLTGKEMQVKNTLPKRSPQKHVREGN